MFCCSIELGFPHASSLSLSLPLGFGIINLKNIMSCTTTKDGNDDSDSILSQYLFSTLEADYGDVIFQCFQPRDIGNLELAFKKKMVFVETGNTVLISRCQIKHFENDYLIMKRN